MGVLPLFEARDPRLQRVELLLKTLLLRAQRIDLHAQHVGNALEVDLLDVEFAA
jgi:hypothetical protein